MYHVYTWYVLGTNVCARFKYYGIFYRSAVKKFQVSTKFQFQYGTSDKFPYKNLLRTHKWFKVIYLLQCYKLYIYTITSVCPIIIDDLTSVTDLQFTSLRFIQLNLSMNVKNLYGKTKRTISVTPMT